MKFRFLFLAASLAGLVPSVQLNATTVVPPEFSELVNGSDYIVRAKVKAITHEVRTVGSRQRPYTLVELEVIEVIAGTPPAPLVLSLLGGPVGQDELVIQGAPKFAVGDEDILFVAGNGRTVYPLYGMMHGRFPIMKEASGGREYIARSNHLPLSDTAQISQPMSDVSAAAVTRSVSAARAMGPSDFVSKIKAARKP